MVVFILPCSISCRHTTIKGSDTHALITLLLWLCTCFLPVVATYILLIDIILLTTINSVNKI